MRLQEKRCAMGAIRKIERLMDVIRGVHTAGLDSWSKDLFYIEQYYRDKLLGLSYAFFHSDVGALHMALNPKVIFDRKGYYVRPMQSRSGLQRRRRRVLELASGMALMLAFLAVKFSGSAVYRN